MTERNAGSWLELPELVSEVAPVVLTMRDEWLARFGPLSCAACGRPICSGEAFRLAGRCAMGGVVPAAQLAVYADMLEPLGEHVDCVHIGEAGSRIA